MLQEDWFFFVGVNIIPDLVDNLQILLNKTMAKASFCVFCPAYYPSIFLGLLILCLVAIVDTYYKWCFLSKNELVNSVKNLKYINFVPFKILHLQKDVFPKQSIPAKYKLDELPQLFNVLKGDMVCGDLSRIASYYDLEEGKAMLELKPGLTSSAALKVSNEEELLGQQRSFVFNDRHLFRIRSGGFGLLLPWQFWRHKNY
jgi:hypothetical protein